MISDTYGLPILRRWKMKTKLVLALGFVMLIAALAVALAGFNATGGVAASQQLVASSDANNQQGIWVSGEGDVPVTPDIAILNLGISAQASTVADAQSQAVAAMNKVMSALTSNGVDQKDIQTQYFSIQQVTNPIPPTPMPTPYLPLETPNGSGNGTSPMIPVPIKPPVQPTTGYEVTNMVTVKIRAIDNTGAIIDATVEAGGDLLSIDGVTFSVDQPDQYYAQARQLAMNDAKAKANQLAELAGVTLGKATYISESTTPIVYPEVFNAQVATSSASTPINPGQTDIIVDVQVAYAIQ
jgi:uncharacterized protein YggE